MKNGNKKKTRKKLKMRKNGKTEKGKNDKRNAKK